MNFNEAQKDMRDAYLSGGSGILISSIVWITAGIFAIYTTKQISFMVFFIGGMLIHPAGHAAYTRPCSIKTKLINNEILKNNISIA